MIFDAFHICCQKVLPAVYDESLSYYEVVCKLVYAMQVLDKSMTDLEARMDVLDKISTELWPQFQAEVNATLQQYAKAYEDFQTGIEADISKFESDLETMNTNLANSIKEQNDAIAAANAAQMALLTERLAQQDANISQIQSTVEQNSQDMADLTMDVHDFIAQYSPPATINGLSPQFLITANAGASIKVVQGLIELTAIADGAGKAVINVSNYGDWVVTSEYQGQTKSVTVSVDDVKQYTVNVEHAEKTYTFILNPIPNFADLPSIITESMFQITGPNGYSVTKPVQATAQSFSVPGPGEYSFDLKIANIYPDASSETGYKAASASGAVIYTSTPGGSVIATMPDSSVNNSSTVTPMGLPYFQATLPDDKQITVTSPVTATDVEQTMTGESTTYKFIPWTTGLWKFNSSAVQLAQSSLTATVWISPSVINMRLSLFSIPQISSFSWPQQITIPNTEKRAATAEDIAPIQAIYDEVWDSFKLSTVAISNDSKIQGTISTFPYTLDIGIPFDNDSMYAGLLIPAFKYDKSSKQIIGVTKDDPDIHAAFYSPDGTPHDSVIILAQFIHNTGGVFTVPTGPGATGPTISSQPLPNKNSVLGNTNFSTCTFDIACLLGILNMKFAEQEMFILMNSSNGLILKSNVRLENNHIVVQSPINNNASFMPDTASNKPNGPSLAFPAVPNLEYLLIDSGVSYYGIGSTGLAINPDMIANYKSSPILSLDQSRRITPQNVVTLSQSTISSVYMYPCTWVDRA